MQKNKSTLSLISENLQNYTSNANVETQCKQATKSGLISIHQQSDHLHENLKTSFRTSTDPDALVFKGSTKAVLHRKKKRAWLKRRRERLKIEKIKTLLLRKEKDKQIDENLALEKKREEDARRARRLALDAQEGLAEVMVKINDAENHIAYLESQLSQKKTLKFSGNVEEAEKELNVWQQTLENYKTEEKNFKMQIIAGCSSPDFHWCQALFGCSSLTDGSSSKRTFEEFIELRRSWDSHIVPAGSNFGSQMPFGWVMPNTNPMPSWSALRS